MNDFAEFYAFFVKRFYVDIMSTHLFRSQGVPFPGAQVGDNTTGEKEEGKRAGRCTKIEGSAPEKISTIPRPVEMYFHKAAKKRRCHGHD